jgi:hypothetical protein
MKAFIRILFFMTLMQIFHYGTVIAQGGSADYKDGMTVRLDSSGKKYIRFLTWATFWARQTNANPGTAVNGIAANKYTDFGLRQFRFLTYSQLSPRYLILADIGIDNQTFSSGGTPGGGNTGNGGPVYGGTLGKKAELYLHDLWNEYAIYPEKDSETEQQQNASLYIGTGLHYWNGISRMTSSGSANYLALDVPLYNWPLVDLSDQFARQLGIYLKGNIGRLSYRWAINKPFTVLSNPVQYPAGTPDSAFAVDNNATGKIATTGYAAWQFLEKENNLLPYTTGTYVGTMRVFNIGAGYYNAAQGTVTQKRNSATSDFDRHAITLWAVDAFADLPFGSVSKNWAFTGYTVFYHYDMGPNYLRYGAIMNENVGQAPGYQGKVSQAGFGNSAPIIGSGYSWLTQAGLLLPKTIFNGKIRLQPFGEYSYQKFERFGVAKFTYWSAGGNIYIDGHHARITVKYQTRPIVVNNIQDSSKGSFIIATQVNL